MTTYVVKHPVVEHALVKLRDKTTPNEIFRANTERIATFLGVEATREMETEQVKVETPVAISVGEQLSGPAPLVVPILRAGLGLKDAFLDLLPNAELGLIGIRRDEETALPSVYLDKMPTNLEGRTVFVVDPMLATAGSMAVALEMIEQRNPKRIVAVCIVAAPEGVQRIEASHPKVDLYVAAVDEGLNEQFYIVPGLGDAGDRLFGPNLA